MEMKFTFECFIASNAFDCPNNEKHESLTCGEYVQPSWAGQAIFVAVEFAIKWLRSIGKTEIQIEPLER